MSATDKPWAPERVVTPRAAAALIEAQFAPLRPARVQPLGEGWDNTVYLVNEEWVFRFPRRAIAAQLIAHEAAVLPRIAAALPLAVPAPEWLGRPAGDFPWPFFGYRLLPGRPASAADLSAEQRRTAARPLAEFLAALHAIDATQAGAPPDTLARSDMGRRIPALQTRLRALAELGLIPAAGPWEKLLERLDGGGPAPHPPGGAEIQPPEGPVPAHGDLYAGHLLVDGQGRLSGVIDWGDVHAGHPGVDLAVAFGFLPPAARQAFWRHYPPVDAATLRLARLRALFHAATVAAYGHDRGDGDLVREGLAALHFVLDD